MLGIATRPGYIAQYQTRYKVIWLTGMWLLVYIGRIEATFGPIFIWSWNENGRTKQKQKTNGIERFDWFIERIQTRVAFGWLSECWGEKKLHARELSRNQSILRFDVILQHDWPIEQCLLHIRVFFGGKTKRPCFDLFIHWLIKQITNTYQKPFFKVIWKSLYWHIWCKHSKL